ncbi:kinase-like domain-containing protein [Fomitopsis serialis]|uniref:kinase-like domain-containing protein n=1 Tax=Fomitopsis serialis TaxID=139415 RepID=UPI002007C140|nr:kinase-like domain-containing protein [Neoantrodia serialis]KAH9911135.1 kinase-like domain-containing protein [Neoantrodia serialis]
MSMSLVCSRIGGRFQLKTKISSGSFGTWYISPSLSCSCSLQVSLEHEVTIYKNLGRMPSIPRAPWFGAEDGYNVLVLDLLGPLLASSPLGNEPVFRLQAVLAISNQMVRSLDIKPSSFLFGPDLLSQKVFLVDFGLAKQYWDPIQHSHIPYRDGLQLTGTALWASINVHVGIEHLRRDDIESLAYIIIYLLHGYLPWQDLTVDVAIFQRKQSLSPTALCLDLPVGLTAFVAYICSLPFVADPNYLYLHCLLQTATERVSSESKPACTGRPYNGKGSRRPLTGEGSGYGFGKKQAGVVYADIS